MNLFERKESQGREERQPEIPRVQIQGEEAVIPRTGDPEGGDRVSLPKKIWG
jgi:hypothetical protein